MEQRIKQILGEYAFTVAALQHQLEAVQKELEDLKKDKDENKSKR